MNARRLSWFARLERSHRFLLVAVSLSGMLLTGAWYVWGYTSKIDFNESKIEWHEKRIEKIETIQNEIQASIRESLAEMKTDIRAIKERLDREEGNK